MRLLPLGQSVTKETLMKIDIFTKAVLSVIAVSLASIAFRDVPVISTAQAQPSDRGDNVMKVQIVSIDESPSLRWEAIPVKME
jgi:hypothetical protein